MDQTKYVNTYIDTLMGMIHELTTQLLQLRTQIRVVNDTITEKDGIITDLSNKLQVSQITEQEYHRVLQRNQELESEIGELKNKASHIDTFAYQINTMKQIILEKDAIIDDMNKKNNVRTIPKKQKSAVEPIPITGTNDF